MRYRNRRFLYFTSSAVNETLHKFTSQIRWNYTTITHRRTVFSFFHNVSIGLSSAAQTSLSNLAARVSARFSIFSCVMTLLLDILCDDRSMFSGSPKYDGVSASGNTSMASMKSCHIHTSNTTDNDQSLSTACQLVWHSGRMLVFGQQTFTVLHSTCSWWVTIYMGKPSAICQPIRPIQPFIPLGSINN